MIATLLAAAAAGQAAPPVPPQPAPQSNQARFDAASAAATAGRCDEAVAGFDAVAAAPAYRRNALLAAAVDVRRGGCLVQLGRPAEGAVALRRGLPVLEAKGGDFVADVREGQLALGAAARAAFDYDGAATAYRAAADAVPGEARVIPLLRLSQVLMFDRDGRALAAAEEARTLVAASKTFNRKDSAATQTQYARVLLNQGRTADAYKELKDGLAKQGGLTPRVGLSDIATRSDLAIAAILNKRPDDARLYLAYSGAGRTKDTPFGRAAVMSPPACGEGGITPDDRAVVEFTLEDDGRVSGVTPIWVTGGRDKAVAFARAVSDWSWRGDDVKKIPLLFRYTSRVELRCSRALGGPGLLKPLSDAAADWLNRAGPAPWADLSAAAALPLQRAELARAQGVGDRAGVARAAIALADNETTSGEEAETLLAQAAAAASAANAPPAVLTYAAVRQARRDEFSNAARTRRDLRALLARPAVSGDPLSADTVRLLIARPIGSSAPPPDAAVLVSAVVDDAALPSGHPLKVAALLGRANALAAGGDTAGARTAFAATGLSAEQCDQLGLTPDLRSAGASSADYPMEAVRLGFEGWVMAEADVGPDGRTVGPRAVVAYPPFVFDDAATGIARGARYASSFRPNGALACQGARLPIRFMLP